MEFSASRIAEKCEINRSTVNRMICAARIRISERCEMECPLTNKPESLKGTGKETLQKLEAGDFVILFALIRDRGRIYTCMVEKAAVRKAVNLLLCNFGVSAVVCKNGSRFVDGLEAYGDRGLLRFYSNEHEPLLTPCYIAEVENFWNISMERLIKFRGMHSRNFYLHLKESEFRFNHRHEDLFRLLLELF